MSMRQIEDLRVAVAKLERQVDDNHDFFLATRDYVYTQLREICACTNTDAEAIKYLFGRMSDMHELVGPLAGVNLPNLDNYYEPEERVIKEPPPGPGRPR